MYSIKNLIKLIPVLIFILFSFSSKAQTGTQKANNAVDNVKAKVDLAEQTIKNTINKAEVLRGQAKAALQDIKDLTKVFEPVFWLHGKNKQYDIEQNPPPSTNEQYPAYNDTQTTSHPENSPYPSPGDNNTNPQPSYTPYTDPALSGYYTNQESYNNQAATYVPENANYNSDGSANLGSQNNTSYGCYIDIIKGGVMDEIDAATDPQNVDLIFTATDYFNASVPMYAFLTPSYAKYDKFAYNFFKGNKYKDQQIPPLNWEVANESEVAFAPITGEQFEKIQNNKQLMAVVKQCGGFSGKIESRTKLDGKVIAIKTEMGDRTAYGLMYIVSHFGTTGPNGYLKVKIKVLGFDASGNGYPDPFVYQF